MANPFERALRGQSEPPPWPIHPAPLEDELLSSWFARLAYANHQSASSFAAVACPGRRLLRHDLDRIDAATLLALLATRARVTPERLCAATLAAHTGRLYVTAHTNAPWLLPMWRQKSQAAAGLAFCPDCLAQSVQPYFRRCWRLAFVTSCEAHGRLLQRGCPHCGAAVRLFDAPMDYQHRVTPEPPHVCLRCGHDLRGDHSLAETPLAAALSFQNHLLLILERGWTTMERDKPLYSHLYFEVLHKLVRLLKPGGPAPGLAVAAREGLGLRPGSPRSSRSSPSQSRFEQLSPSERGERLAMAGWLLEDWPERFVEVCRRARVMATTLMDDMEPPPFWYWSVIAERLRVMYARWRDPAKPRGAQPSYAQTGPRGPNAFLAAQEKRILFVRAHPELWRRHAALAKALKAAGLYRPSTHWTKIQKHCPKLVALARQPSEGRRPEKVASRAPGTPGDRQRRSLPRRERRIRFVRAHRELWPQLRALADALQAAGLYSPAVSNYNIRQRCPAFIALARERDAAAQAGKSARKATCPPVPADG